MNWKNRVDEFLNKGFVLDSGIDLLDTANPQKVIEHLNLRGWEIEDEEFGTRSHCIIFVNENDVFISMYVCLYDYTVTLYWEDL